jgi:hypothetical protein
MNNTNKKDYALVDRLPIARFAYPGSHDHPVQRVVGIIEETDTHIRGYEFRCGREYRSLSDVKNHIRSYRKDRIAKYGDYVRLRATSTTLLKDPEESTLTRESILDFLKSQEFANLSA